MNFKQLNIMNNLEQSYKKILEVLSKFFGKKLQNYQRRKPKMSDLEVVSLAYGYKLHAICSLNGIFQSIDMSPASVHDIRYLNDVKEQLSNCTLIGDKGYLSAEVQIDLFNYANIQLDTPKRTNQKDYRPQFRLFRKKRKRIETLFSQLCDQFMIKRNYAKSFEGFKTRIFSKMTYLTLIQYINKFILNREIHNLKASII